MRCYCITNMYLSPIQKGIQSAHAVHTLFTDYRGLETEDCQASKDLYDWAELHQTMIVLNGGPSPAMEDGLGLLKRACGGHRRAWSYFKESWLNDALTCLAVVAPTWYYDPDLKSGFNHVPEQHQLGLKLSAYPGSTVEDFLIIDYLNSLSLAI